MKRLIILTTALVFFIPAVLHAQSNLQFGFFGLLSLPLGDYGSEDLEICLRAWLLGHEVIMTPEVEVSHLFRTRFPYQVSWTDVLHNMLRTAYAHFNSERAERVIAALRSLPGFEPAYSRVKSGDIWDRRRTLELRRKRDDNWFFDRFGLSF